MRDVTLCYLVEPERLILANKKRGFGAGKVNGYGGKLAEDESIEQATLRELTEESGVTATANALDKVAEIDFHFPEKPDWDQRVHVFLIRVWEGEPAESEEMAPEWYPLDALPYDRMWSSDMHWLPRVLQGERVRGAIVFNGEGGEVASAALEPF